MDGHPSDVHPLTPSHGWIPMVSGFGVANTWVSKHQTHDFQAKKQGKKPVSIGWNCRLKHVETCWNWCFQICSKCWCIDSYTDFRQDGQDGHNPSLAPIGYLESLVEKCRKYGICIMIYSLQLAQSWQIGYLGWLLFDGLRAVQVFHCIFCLQSRKFEGLWNHALGWTKQIEAMTPLIFAGLISATAFCSVDQSIFFFLSLEPVPEQTTWYPLHKQKPQ